MDQWLCVPEREIESMCGSVSQASQSSSARKAHVHPLELHLFSGMPTAGAPQAFVHGLLLFVLLSFVVSSSGVLLMHINAHSVSLTCGASLGSQRLAFIMLIMCSGVKWQGFSRRICP